MKLHRNIILGLLLVIFQFASMQTAKAQVRDLFNNTNPAGVRNGPTNGPQFVVTSPTTITQLITYHWNFGQGSKPGAIALQSLTPGGRNFGPFPAIGTAGFRNARNVNWIANVNITIPAGRYTVIDSDRSTWSNNSQSGFQGFAIVRGFSTAGPSALPDRGSDNPNTPTPLIPVSSMPAVGPNLLGQTVSDSIGGADVHDYYYLTVTGPNGSQDIRGVNFVLTGFSGNVQLTLEAYDQIRQPFPNPPVPAGQIVATAAPFGSPKVISRSLLPGNYRVHIMWNGAQTNYTLLINSPAR